MHLHRRRTTIVILAGLLVALAAGGGLQAYRYRCRIITCDPASWATIHDLVRAKMAEAGPDYAFDPVLPLIVQSAPQTPFTTQGPAELELQASFVSRVPEPRDATLYLSKVISFNDHDLWVTWGASGGGTGPADAPTLEERRQWELRIAQTPQRFAQVTVDPRAVYAQTWPRAQALFGSALRPPQTSLYLYLEDMGDQLHAPLWAIMYSSEDGDTSRSSSIEQLRAIADQIHTTFHPPSFGHLADAPDLQALCQAQWPAFHAWWEREHGAKEHYTARIGAQLLQLRPEDLVESWLTRHGTALRVPLRLVIEFVFWPADYVEHPAPACLILGAAYLEPDRHAELRRHVQTVLDQLVP